MPGGKDPLATNAVGSRNSFAAPAWGRSFLVSSGDGFCLWVPINALASREGWLMSKSDLQSQTVGIV